MGTNETVVYLSHVQLKEHVNVLRPYQAHRTVMRAFGNLQNERVLFRIEDDNVIVQSLKMPNWQNASNKLRSSSVTRQRLDFTTGQTLSFKLLANPTVKRGGKRCGLHTEFEQRAWLERKANDGGFKILELNICKIGTITGSTKNKHELSLLAIEFDGLLHVLAPDRLHACIRNGIGSGKGVGFGLLSVQQSGATYAPLWIP